MNEFLEILRQNETFQKVMSGIREERPIIPLHTYDPDNTEEWKALSNQQRGYDLALALLGEHNE